MAAGVGVEMCFCKIVVLGTSVLLHGARLNGKFPQIFPLAMSFKVPCPPGAAFNGDQWGRQKSSILLIGSFSLDPH